MICPCGNRGCLETIASAVAIANLLNRSRREQMFPQQIVELVRAGDARERAVPSPTPAPPSDAHSPLPSTSSTRRSSSSAATSLPPATSCSTRSGTAIERHWVTDRDQRRAGHPSRARRERRGHLRQPRSSSPAPPRFSPPAWNTRDADQAGVTFMAAPSRSARQLTKAADGGAKQGCFWCPARPAPIALPSVFAWTG